jgi:hypothetical protein
LQQAAERIEKADIANRANNRKKKKVVSRRRPK